MPKAPELTWDLIVKGKIVRTIVVPHGKPEPSTGWPYGIPPGISRKPASKEKK